jgi:hypothetical protein
MRSSVIKKLGFTLYHILTLRSENLNHYEFNECCDKIYDILLEIAPPDTTRELNPDIKEFVEQTNRRLRNG